MRPLHGFIVPESLMLVPAVIMIIIKGISAVPIFHTRWVHECLMITLTTLTHMHACRHTCMYACMHTHACTHACTHTHTHIHTHTHCVHEGCGR